MADDSSHPTWHDPPDVNDAGGPERHVARNRLHQKRHDEEKALAALPPEVAGAYGALRALLADELPQAALQQLLLVGKLHPTAPNRDGEELLDALATVAAAPLVAGISRPRFLAELLKELADPAAINQHLHATCGVAAVQILLALTEPAEYVRLLGDLARPEGEAVMRSGRVLRREEGTEARASVRKGAKGAWSKDDRSDPARLFQSAAMEFANGPLDYDPVKDQHVDAAGSVIGQGLGQAHVSDLVSALFNRRTRTVEAGEHQAAMLEEIGRIAEAGQPVPTGLAWHQRDKAGRVHEQHEVLVTRVDAQRVYFLNPWGRAESMPRAEFTKRLLVASLMAPVTAKGGLGWWPWVATAAVIAGALLARTWA